MDLRDALYTAFTNGKEPPSDVRGLVSALGGTRAAADALGVTTRTVQRWTTTTGAQKRNAPAAKVAQLRTAVRDSPAVRAQLVGQRRAARLRNSGTSVRIKGMQGVSSEYARRRHITTAMPGRRIEPALTAWLGGDDDAAAAAFLREFVPEYGKGSFDTWTFEDLDGVEFRR